MLSDRTITFAFSLGLLLTGFVCHVNAAPMVTTTGESWLGFDREPDDGTVLDAAFNVPVGSVGTRVILDGSTNAEAAEALFFASLTGMVVGTEDFEGPYGLPLPSAPLGLEFGATGITATMTGAGVVESITPADEVDFVHRAGRYPISGSQYWDTNFNALNVAVASFNTPIRAFGFFVTDAGDFDGQIVIRVSHVSGPDEVMTILHPSDDPSGFYPGSNAPDYNASLLYFGFLEETDDLITGFSFSNTNANGTGDRFGIDDITVAVSSDNVDPVPEPSSLALLLSAALTAAVFSRRRSRRARVESKSLSA